MQQQCVCLCISHMRKFLRLPVYPAYSGQSQPLMGWVRPSLRYPRQSQAREMHGNQGYRGFLGGLLGEAQD